MAVCTTILLDRYHVDYVINYGVAGSINTKIGETVVSDAVRYYDFYIRNYKVYNPEANIDEVEVSEEKLLKD